MPQIQLPIFPTDSVHITPELAFKNESGKIFYFNGSMPVFSHDKDDIQAFRMITSQFYVNGNATQSQIARAFGVTLVSVKRAVKTYRTDGISGFYSPKKTRGAAVLTDSVLQDVQARLDSGISVPDIATEFGLKKNTLSKAIGAGRLHNPLKKRRFNPRRQYAPGYIHQN
jgi:transposase-like protein